VGDGKGQDALKPFWKRLRSSKAKIKAVATDMSSAYYAGVQSRSIARMGSLGYRGGFWF
jgi:hypothetical protein